MLEKGWSHGWNLSSAVASSCDVFFYRLAEISGIDMIHDKLQKFGFGQKTYIDLYGEKSGLLPSLNGRTSQDKQLGILVRLLMLELDKDIFGDTSAVS